ncbi:MAG: peptidase U32 family protein, partial [Peptostreptococcaceae bacterium]
MINKIELQAPARDLNSLKIAIEAGADAVYIGGESFGMKTSSKEFTKEDIYEGVKFAHSKGKKVYVTITLLPHTNDFKELEEYLLELEEAKVDALIISEPGVLETIKKVVPNMKLHLSTLANVNNYATANFWYEQGIRRIALARELSLKEMQGIKSNIAFDMELEAFVHGGMCMSYSGRKLLTSYIATRDINIYSENKKYNLVEEKRQGEYCPVYEDEGGTFFFSSRDLCMIEFIPDLIKSGVDSFSIEGIQKDSEYVELVVKSYRKAIDDFYNNPNEYKFDEELMKNIRKSN